MPVSDYNKYKDLIVDSVSGTPTVSKVQPIYLTSGDDSTTGNGEVVLDWSNISGSSDVAVFDQNDNLLDYEIEELDTTNETGVLWVYSDWARDGTVQGRIAYGSGPEDRSMAGAGSNPWDNGQKALMVQHFEDDPLSLNDSSPNNNDCTNNGAVSGQGQISSGVSFDGTDDYIDTPLNMNSDTSDLTIALWIYPEEKDKQKRIISSYDGVNAFSIRQDSDNTYKWATYDGSFYGVLSAGSVDLSVWKNMVCRWDGTDLYELSFDGSTVASVTESNFATNSLVEGIGDRASGQNQKQSAKFNGELDAVRFYDERKSDAWVTSDYDASAKAGQIFFSQESAQTTDDTATDKSALIATSDLKFKAVIYSVNYLATSGVSDFGLNSRDLDCIYSADTTNMDLSSPLSSNIYSAYNNTANMDLSSPLSSNIYSAYNNTANMEFSSPLSSNIYSADSINFEMGVKDTYYIYKAGLTPGSLGFIVNNSGTEFRPDTSESGLSVSDLLSPSYIKKAELTHKSLTTGVEREIFPSAAKFSYEPYNSKLQYTIDTSESGLSVSDLLSPSYIKKTELTHTALTSDVEREIFPSAAKFSYEPYNSKLQYTIDTSESGFTSVIKASFYDSTPSIRYEREASIVRSIYKIVEIDRKEDIDASTK